MVSINKSTFLKSKVDLIHFNKYTKTLCDTVFLYLLFYYLFNKKKNSRPTMQKNAQNMSQIIPTLKKKPWYIVQHIL